MEKRTEEHFDDSDSSAGSSSSQGSGMLQEMQDFLNNEIPCQVRREQVLIKIAKHRKERLLPGSAEKHRTLEENIRILKTIDKRIVRKEYEEQRRLWCKNRRFLRKLSVSWNISINHLIVNSRPAPCIESIAKASEPAYVIAIPSLLYSDSVGSDGEQ